MGGQAVTEEYTGSARPWPCRYCHAGPDEPCRHAAGWRVDKPHGSRYKRPRGWRDPLAVDEQLARSISAFPDNMNRRILFTDDCWHWRGAVTSSGYGSVAYEGRLWSTHRLAYELLIGPIPDGLQIDHLCRNKVCCNPQHLEPVTAQENLRRQHQFRYGSRVDQRVEYGADHPLVRWLNGAPSGDRNPDPLIKSQRMIHF
jgi:hypothetical protein